MFDTMWFKPPPGAPLSPALRRGLRFRYLCTIVAAVWTVAYLTVYLYASVSTGGAIQWLYVLNLVVPIVLLLWSLRSPYARGMLLISAGLLALATVLGLTWIGLLLAPTVVLALIAARRPFHP